MTTNGLSTLSNSGAQSDILKTQVRSRGINQIPSIGISVHIEHVHAQNPRLLRKRRLESNALRVIVCDHVPGRLGAQEGGRRARVPVARVPARAVEPRLVLRRRQIDRGRRELERTLAHELAELDLALAVVALIVAALALERDRAALAERLGPRARDVAVRGQAEHELARGEASRGPLPDGRVRARLRLRRVAARVAEGCVRPGERARAPDVVVHDEHPVEHGRERAHVRHRRAVGAGERRRQDGGGELGGVGEHGPQELEEGEEIGAVIWRDVVARRALLRGVLPVEVEAVHVVLVIESSNVLRKRLAIFLSRHNGRVISVKIEIRFCWMGRL
jgi:hypothetical protein